MLNEKVCDTLLTSVSTSNGLSQIKPDHLFQEEQRYKKRDENEDSRAQTGQEIGVQPPEFTFEIRREAFCGRARLPPIMGLIILSIRYIAYAGIRHYLRY